MLDGVLTGCADGTAPPSSPVALVVAVAGNRVGEAKGIGVDETSGTVAVSGLGADVGIDFSTTVVAGDSKGTPLGKGLGVAEDVGF